MKPNIKKTESTGEDKPLDNSLENPTQAFLPKKISLYTITLMAVISSVIFLIIGYGMTGVVIGLLTVIYFKENLADKQASFVTFLKIGGKLAVIIITIVLVIYGIFSGPFIISFMAQILLLGVVAFTLVITSGGVYSILLKSNIEK
ncbi:MAG: hypothetical protein ACTSWY_12940 [Promethearchaeota archaeon]